MLIQQNQNISLVNFLRWILISGLPILLSSVSVSAATDKELFSDAYTAYETCMEKQDYTCSLNNAKIAFEHGKKIFPINGKNIANLAHNYGVSAMMARSPKELSYSLLQDALSFNEKAYGNNSPEVLTVLIDVLKAQMDMDESVVKKDRYWDRAVSLSETLNGKDSEPHADTLMHVSGVMLNGRAYNKHKSQEFADQAYAIYKDILGNKNPKTALTAFNLGKYRLGIGRYREAAGYFEEALLGFEVKGTPDNRFALSTHAFLVEAYENLKLRDEATKHCVAIGAMTPDDPNREYLPLFQGGPDLKGTMANAPSDKNLVVVGFTVDSKGIVVDPKVLEGTTASKKLQDASLAWVQRFRFAPRFRDGKAVDTQDVTYRFKYGNN